MDLLSRGSVVRDHPVSQCKTETAVDYSTAVFLFWIQIQSNSFFVKYKHTIINK